MDAQYYRDMAALQKDHWWYEGRRQILSALIARLDLPENATILEAGCGPGANLDMLQNFGNVSAFEPDDFAARHAGEISGLPVKSGALPEPFPFEETFDLIGAFDVIEHIEDDLGALRVLRGKLKEEGYAVFTVPAHQWLWSHHDEINHHKRRYSRRGFRQVLEEAGFEIEKISYYNMWLFPLAVTVRYLKKWMGRDDESDVQMPAALVNKILYTLFSSEKHSLKVMNQPFGLSIIAVCRKN
ncbi:MAG: class I SAM-dependent methyltransferase [Alphaproteobacteria bacterium]